MNEKVLELINYYIERYEETKRDEFIIAGFNQMRLLMNGFNPERVLSYPDGKETVDKARNSIVKVFNMSYVNETDKMIAISSKIFLNLSICSF